MADLKITGGMKVKSVKASFKKAFGASLRVYKGNKFADDDATIASIRKGNSLGGEFSVHGATLVGNFEKRLKKELGVTVQVANAKDTELADNKLTLTQAGKK